MLGRRERVAGWRHVSVIVAVTLALWASPLTLSVTWSSPAGASAEESAHRAADDELPPGVSDVTVTSDGTERGRWLEFDSELLGVRAVNHVLLPPGYREDGPAHGTLYRLHGTRGAATSLLPPTAATEAAAQDSAVAGDETAAAQAAPGVAETFLVVALDEGTPWCDRCWWVDGRDGQGVLAESHLLHEVIPTVEAVFNVRSDRGGRAVYGTSMGGIGALIQAFRHPDVFSYVGSQSGSPSQGEHRDESQIHQDNLYYTTYLLNQGYPDPATNPIAYRNIDVNTLAPQVVGTDLEIVLWAGDGCLPPYDDSPQPVGDPDCLRTSSPEPMDAFHMVNERGIRNQNEVLAARLLDVGIPFRLETGHGRHGVSSMYADHIIPDLNHRFAAPPPRPPRTFSYKTTDRQFSIWGYEVEVLQRPNEEFLYLLGAELDGRALTVAGTGQAAIRLPAAVMTGRPAQITVTPENADPETQTLTADEDCWLTVELDLGATRSIDERRDLARNGMFATPRTHIVVDIAPGDALPDGAPCT